MLHFTIRIGTPFKVQSICHSKSSKLRFLRRPAALMTHSASFSFMRRPLSFMIRHA